MARYEGARYQLHQGLEKVLGPEEATTLMEHLPPGGWSNLATKDDLRNLESRLRAFTLRTVLTTNIVSIAALAGIAFAALRPA